MFDGLRQQLDARGLTPAMVVLAGEDHGIPLEGALHLGPADAGGFELATVDYGSKTVLRTAPDEASAAQMLLDYVDQPLPPVARFASADVEQAINAATPHLADLVDRTQRETLLIQLPVGLLVDRIGVLDGTQFFPYGTSFEARALPPTALGAGADRHMLLTRANVLVRVGVAQPWFGRAGGGLRMTLADDFVGIRDLVAQGVLERFTVAGQR